MKPIPRLFTHSLAILACLAASSLTHTLADSPTRDVSNRARQIGTDKPQNPPARLIITKPGQARLKFPAFVLGIEKASRKVIGCPPERGLDIARASRTVRDQMRRTFHETPLATDCLFVSHIAEFVATPNPDEFQPVLRYDAYREIDPPAPRDVFMSGRRATLALYGRLAEIAAGRTVTGRPVSHLIVFATGWHTPQAKTLADMDELFDSIEAAAAGDDAFSPLFFGISWPSFSDEIADNIETGASVLARLAPPASGLPARTKTLSRLLENPVLADKLGFLGYPAISKDADEVGMVAVSTLVNQVLIPLREALPAKPRVIVIGHSFGARIASWTPFTASLLPSVPGIATSAGPDIVIGLQGAFPAARFDTTITHRRPYVEGAPFADRANLRTVFAYTTANDEALRHGRIFDIMIGDARALERAKADQTAAFATCKASDDEVAAVRFEALRKALLIDARDIVTRHNDVRNPEVGRLIWSLIRRFTSP